MINNSNSYNNCEAAYRRPSDLSYSLRVGRSDVRGVRAKAGIREAVGLVYTQTCITRFSSHGGQPLGILSTRGRTGEGGGARSEGAGATEALAKILWARIL